MTICKLRADHLGTYGYAIDTSPALDRLARRSIVFERVLAPTPWTMPSMGAMVTGLYPRYLAIDPPGPHLYGLRDGFETAAERFSEAGYTTLGVVTNPNVNAAFGFHQGCDVYHDTGKNVWGSGFGRSTKITAEKAAAALLEQIRALPDGALFFAHLVLMDVHGPLMPEVARRRNPTFRVRSGRTRPYDEQIRYVDSVLADRLAELRTEVGAGVLLVINSDHGQDFGERAAGSHDIESPEP